MTAGVSVGKGKKQNSPTGTKEGLSPRMWHHSGEEDGKAMDHTLPEVLSLVGSYCSVKVDEIWRKSDES